MEHHEFKIKNDECLFAFLKWSQFYSSMSTVNKIIFNLLGLLSKYLTMFSSTTSKTSLPLIKKYNLWPKGPFSIPGEAKGAFRIFISSEIKAVYIPPPRD
jgi:hypothetical protein